jgi:hypothetical protein
MGKRDGHIFRPAVVSQEGISSGFLITLDRMQMGSKTFCVLVNYQPWVELAPLRTKFKYFERQAELELCSTSSFSAMSAQLEGMQTVNEGVLGILALFMGYKLDRGRVVAGISLTIFDELCMIIRTSS